MAFPNYTVKNLSDFSNKPEAYFTNFAPTAITQASLLFRIASCLKDLPEDNDSKELVQSAILDMAFKIYEASKWSTMQYSPISSETIGSYSYSKSLAKIQLGESTGVMWFDLAVASLGVCEFISGDGAHSSGGIEVFEHDGAFINGDYPGNERLLSPDDIGHVPGYNGGW